MSERKIASKDSEIQRACELQAKWNGTSIEEEYKKTMSFKKNMKAGFAIKSKEEVKLLKAAADRVLLRTEAQACKYYNKHIKGIKNPCEGNECTLNCKYCLEVN